MPQDALATLFIYPNTVTFHVSQTSSGSPLWSNDMELSTNPKVNTDGQFNGNLPSLDLNYATEVLFQQQKYHCYYSWIATGKDQRLKALQNSTNELKSLLFSASLFYRNKTYVISKFSHKDSDEAMAYCQAFGGYLAEVDDYSEFKELQNFFMSSSVEEMALIAGSNAANGETWRFQRTGVALPFKSWGTGEPNNEYGIEECLCLWRIKNGNMNDIACGFRNDKARFMCELPGSN
ncbi:perlucin-like protein [Biomphalaria glabrata]|nr:perlucin-like protein [Biomphalaria glabrata]